MAYSNPGSMSPPAKPAPPPISSPTITYTQYPNATSPTTASPHAPPPAKRQRLSPDVRSPPNGTASFAPSPAPPVGAYGNPYAAPAAYGTYSTPPQPSFNVPQPYHAHQVQWQSQPSTPATVGGRQGSPPNSQSHSSQMMPPPPRPVKEEKDDKISADDIGDSLFGSGINLKEEENYMHSTFNNRHAADSFASQTTSSSGPSSANNSFNMLTQGTSFDSQGADGPFAGTMGSTQSQEDIEIQERRKRAQAATARNEARQFHLQNQFLNGNCVRRRMDVRSANEGVTLPTLGLYVRTEPETRVAVNNDGTQGIVSVRPECVVEQGSPFDNLLSLVSLAANERLRTLLSEAFALSRARRYGDHGRVPPEFADIASGIGKSISEMLVPESVTGTQWDRLPDAADDRLDSRSPKPPAQPTISFQGKINLNLRQIAEHDREMEKQRVKRREARRRQAENSTGTEEGTGTEGGSAEAGTDTPVKMTKKEQAKQAKAAASAAESEMHTTTNQTAAMMALGKKGARYSWMSGGAAAMPTNRFAKSTGNSGASTPAIKTEDGAGTAALSRSGSGQGAKAPEWGDFREDGPAGWGIQSRDWALVLERDGKEKKALQRVLNKLGSS